MQTTHPASGKMAIMFASHRNTGESHPYTGPVTTQMTALTASKRGPIAALTLGAIGIVFGDIGTSPLYTLRTVLRSHSDADINEQSVLGVISMIIWCLIVIVTVTYVGIITRADNQGEGGIISLAAMIRRKNGRGARVSGFAIAVAVVGAGLFLGDSMITPAISVMSASEGLSVADPDFGSWVVPISVVILALLFLVQPRGTGRIGKAFGPIMALWFVVLAVLGVGWLATDPSVLRALSPTYALSFAAAHPWVAFMALGAAVLAVTGAEALYADLGHFGRRPIVLGWLMFAFPALLLNYLGQGAMLLHDPDALSSPFFRMAPSWALVPIVVLATLATVIASQAVISGAFSIVRQAVHLSLLPRLKIVQTSRSNAGQIYLPAVNALLLVGVLALVLGFGSSERLASAYGLAVTGTLVLELTLFLVFARTVWQWSWPVIATMAVLIGGLELLLLAANSLKVITGGWLPLTISAIFVIIMFTWSRGSKIVFGRRHDMEGPIGDLVDEVRCGGIDRVPGVAVYPHGDIATTPLALRANIDFTHVLHEHVIIVCVRSLGVPHVPVDKRIVVDNLTDTEDGIVQLRYQVGFNDSQNIPAALEQSRGLSPELEIDPSTATYVLSVFRIEPGATEHVAHWPRWQRRLFRALERLSTNRTQAFHLPPERTVVMGAELQV